MKKLLVLLMVLGLAASAQATLTLTLSAATVAIGSTVTVSVSSNTSDAWSEPGGFVLSEDLVNWLDPIAASLSGVATSGVGDLGYGIAFPGYENAAYKLFAGGVTTPAVAGNQFVITITGVQAGTIGIDLQKFGDSSEFADGPLTLTVTPEPMTMALLGLGGLFLRRRK